MKWLEWQGWKMRNDEEGGGGKWWCLDEVVRMEGNEDVGLKIFKILHPKFYILVDEKWKEMKKLGGWWRNWKDKYGEGWVGKRWSSLPW